MTRNGSAWEFDLFRIIISLNYSNIYISIFRLTCKSTDPMPSIKFGIISSWIIRCAKSTTGDESASLSPAAAAATTFEDNVTIVTESQTNNE